MAPHTDSLAIMAQGLQIRHTSTESSDRERAGVGKFWRAEADPWAQGGPLSAEGWKESARAAAGRGCEASYPSSRCSAGASTGGNQGARVGSGSASTPQQRSWKAPPLPGRHTAASSKGIRVRV